MQTILSMVAAGLGVSILPLSAGALGLKKVAMRPLKGKWPPSEMGTAIRIASRKDPLFSKFLQTARQLQSIA